VFQNGLLAAQSISAYRHADRCTAQEGAKIGKTGRFETGVLSGKNKFFLENPVSSGSTALSIGRLVLF